MVGRVNPLHPIAAKCACEISCPLHPQQPYAPAFRLCYLSRLVCFLDLVITCNRKSIEAQPQCPIGTSPQSRSVYLIVGHSTAYIHTLLLQSSTYYLIIQLKRTFAETDQLPVLLVIFRYNGYQHFHRCSFELWASFDSSKAGLFSTKLSLSCLNSAILI